MSGSRRSAAAISASRVLATSRPNSQPATGALAAIAAEHALMRASGVLPPSPAQARSRSSRVSAPALDASSIASTSVQDQRAPFVAPPPRAAPLYRPGGGARHG